MALAATFGGDTLDLIHKSKVLVVGAGGIGCELLKNLVSSGFKEIETIDLDTIEVSNLNRQFLFRKCHVGKSKAKTAADAVKQFDPSITINGHLGNIKSSDFDSEYFSKFDIVLNALDNTEARRHVNRLCLSTNKSFVESGTQGFVGQVIPVIPKLSQCWECTPKQSNQKTYPVCTIRSTPDKPVHCIVWAKLMFALLFGAEDDSNMIKDLKVERKETESVDDFVRNTFIYLFETDITEQLSMEDKWKNRSPPIVIKYSNIESNVASLRKLEKNKKKKSDPMRVLNVEENTASFMATMSELVLRKEECGELVFDKDDNLAMEFVSSAASLRMMCYHIDPKSPFDIKGIAGNIIHAIATTNAITAGCMVVQAVHILKRNQNLKKSEESKQNEESKVEEKEKEKNKENAEETVRCLATRVCWVNSKGRRWLYPQMMECPNPKCFICQKSVVHLTLNPTLFDYGCFVKRILQKHLGFKQPDIAIEFEGGSNLLECVTEEDDEEEKKEKMDLMNKALDDPRIKIFDRASLSIDDFSQDVQVNLRVHYMDLDPEKHPQGFELTNTWTADKFTVSAKQVGGGSVSPGKEQNGIKDKNNKTNEEMKNGDTPNGDGTHKISGSKRKLDDLENTDGDAKMKEIEEPPSKRAKIGS